MKKVIFDLDDLCNKKNCLKQLIWLKKQIPNLKVTLFTIPNRTNRDLLENLKFFDWIELAVHGLYHDSNFEFSKKDYDFAYYNIYKAYNPDFYVKGFKAPGWQISSATMVALRDLGFWVAVQYSDGRMEGNPDGPYQPPVVKGLDYCAINELEDEYISIHGHTWDTCGNGLKDLIPTLLQHKDNQFIFINDYVQSKNTKKL